MFRLEKVETNKSREIAEKYGKERILLIISYLESRKLENTSPYKVFKSLLEYLS